MIALIVEKINKFVSIIWQELGQDTKWLLIWLIQSKFIVGVSCILFNEKYELLLLRHRYWRKGSWGLPSGNIKTGEKPQEAIVREVYEETGFIVEPVDIIMVSSAHRLQIEITFLASIKGGKLNLNSLEILDAAFFGLSQLPDELISRHKNLIRSFMAENIK